MVPGRPPLPAADRRRAEGKQVVRQVRLLHALERSRPGLTVRELLDVADDSSTERTIYRDLEQLERAGFVLNRVAGRHQLVGDGTRALPVTAGELVALMTAERLVAPLAGAWLAGTYRELRRRIAAPLTPAGRAIARELARTVAVSAPDAAPLGERAALLETLRDAIDREHRVRIVHGSPGKAPRERLVDPYGTLRASDGTAYLVARTVDTGEIRKFHIGRIESACQLDQPFERDPAFDLDAYVASSFDAHHGPVEHVVLDVKATVAHLFEEHRYHPTQLVERRDDGSARVAFDAGGLEAIARFVARFGGDVRVLEPAALRAAVLQIHHAGLKANAPDPAPRGRSDTG